MKREIDYKIYNEILLRNKKPMVLDLGCGRSKFKGAIGLDSFYSQDIDVCADLNSFPYPFKNNTFDLIICNHIIEHLSDIPKTMEEIYRISKLDGLVIIRTPYFAHASSFKDPTHKWHLSLKTMDYFTDGKGKDPKYNVNFEKIKEELFFGGEFFNPGRIVCRYSKRLYEKYLCNIFPGYIIYWVLRAKK